MAGKKVTTVQLKSPTGAAVTTAEANVTALLAQGFTQGAAKPTPKQSK